jgi:hypothetical protein
MFLFLTQLHVALLFPELYYEYILRELCVCVCVCLYACVCVCVRAFHTKEGYVWVGILVENVVEEEYITHLY